jgi:hypothetical protein
MARWPFLVKGQEGGCFEGKHGNRRHARIGSGHLGSITAIVRDAGKAASNQAKEGIGRKMLTPFRGNDGQGKPPYENLKSFQ